MRPRFENAETSTHKSGQSVIRAIEAQKRRDDTAPAAPDLAFRKAVTT